MTLDEAYDELDRAAMRLALEEIHEAQLQLRAAILDRDIVVCQREVRLARRAAEQAIRAPDTVHNIRDLRISQRARLIAMERDLARVTELRDAARRDLFARTSDAADLLAEARANVKRLSEEGES